MNFTHNHLCLVLGDLRMRPRRLTSQRKRFGAMVATFCLGLILNAQAVLQITQLNSAQLWQKVEFQIAGIPTGFNPFDPDRIRVDVNISLATGGTMTIPAFWYQGYARALQGSSEQLTASGSPG